MSAAKWSVFSFLCGWIVSIWLLSAMFPAAAADMFCNQCRKQIRPGQGYLMSHGKVYCSRKCYIRTLLECTICRRRSINGGIYAMDHSFFACPDCMKLPRCFSCQIPVRDGAQLSGGRVICPVCARTSVSDQRQAQMIFDEVRNTMRFSLGIVTKHPIRFSLTDQETLHRLSGTRSNQMVEQGLFRYNADVERVATRNFFGRKTGEKVYKKNEVIEIFVLDHLPRIRMEYVMAHELGHDWMTAFYPGIREDWIKEGVAEYLAWRYNQYKKRTDLNRRLEGNTDPVYGGGFRRIRDMVKKRGFQGLKEFLDMKSKQSLKQKK